MTPVELAAWTWKMPRRGRGFWFSLAIDVLWPIVVLFVRLRVRGRQHVPGNGGVILAFNHLSNSDTVAAVVFALMSGRVPRVLAKASLWRMPVIGRVMRSGGHIPVERGTVKASEALKPAAEALLNGECVTVFPEGTFTDDPEGWPMKGKSGVARMALESQVPVIPVAEWGTQDLLPRGHDPAEAVAAQEGRGGRRRAGRPVRPVRPRTDRRGAGRGHRTGDGRHHDHVVGHTCRAIG
ncbi:hypothetical protein GCM10022267_27810 [Lentzea roselyniae]|uniref:Phospholipid/glycerol acyltransferase domain-containing protein n=1 Tax=Lentzea roselyniae TaxID=531940 RepID=A0ABP7ATJ4_9PSEU